MINSSHRIVYVRGDECSNTSDHRNGRIRLLRFTRQWRKKHSHIQFKNGHDYIKIGLKKNKKYYFYALDI